jgi:hypothetical protein
LRGKPWFFAHSENQVHCDDPAFTPEFSERNSGSSFFKWKWTAGSMSRLDGEVKLQTRSMKNECRVRDSARTGWIGVLPAGVLHFILVGLSADTLWNLLNDGRQILPAPSQSMFPN